MLRIIEREFYMGLVLKIWAVSGWDVEGFKPPTSIRGLRVRMLGV